MGPTLVHEGTWWSLLTQSPITPEEVRMTTIMTLFRRFDSEFLEAFVPWHQRTWERNGR